jgi:sialate O-acetylesterase
MKTNCAAWVLCLVLLSLFIGSGADTASADVRLPAVFSDHMVLQRQQPIVVWGWDEPGTEVTVSLGESSAVVAADANGKWSVSLPGMEASGPLQMSVAGTTTQEFSDVLIGEVWLCSGQSNMEWPVRAAADAQGEISAGNHPQIRHIKLQHVPAKTPQEEVPSDGWKVCTPETVGDFTAVGYFFGRKLHTELDVPIGLIGSNWGGTRIEPWTPPVGFQETPALAEITEKLADFPVVNDDGNVNHQTPLALYNGMIHPLVPYGIRGALWYQGESNNGEGMLYHEKMKALISGWRAVWDRPELPFYFVQLAPFRYGGDPLKLPGIWEAQAATLQIPHTGMAVTTDISNLTDIHPANKQDVGERLARWALAQDYGREDVVVSGPLYEAMQVEGDALRLSFRHASGGLAIRGEGPLTWFEIAGADGNYVEASATIDGETVVVRGAGISEPVAARFGWHQEAEPNLVNSAGLPASPFRTARQ